MAIQMRRGADNKFDPAKMLPAEIAVTVDGTRKVYAAFGPGDVKELASKEEVQNIVNNFTGTVDKKIAEAVKQVTDEAQEQIDNIENKAQEVLDSIPADYQNAVKQVEKNTLAIFDLDRFKASAIIQKAKGRSIVIKDSAKAGIPGMRTLGKSEQRKLTGKNLVKSYFVNGRNVGIIALPLTANTTYTVSFTGEQASAIYVRQGTVAEGGDASIGTSIGYVYNANKFTFTPTESGEYHIQLYYGGNAPDISAITNVQLEVGTEVTIYEPYCGGSPVPNPQYPQAIVNAGQRMVDGWQLFDKNAAFIDKGVSTATGSLYTAVGMLATDFIPVRGLTAISWIGETNVGTNEMWGAFFDSNKNFLTKIDVKVVKTVAVPTGAAYAMLTFTREHGIDTIMVNAGTEAKPWEPYTCGGFTDGSQLLKITAVNKLSNGVEFTVNNSSVRRKGTATIDFEYELSEFSLSAGTYCSNVIVYRLTSEGTWVETIQPNTAFVVTDTSQKFRPLIWQVKGVFYDDTVLPMLNRGSVAKAWQPYTAGMKPVIDVPIETEVLSGNLFDFDNAEFTRNDNAVLDSKANGEIIFTRIATKTSGFYAKGAISENFIGHAITVSFKAKTDTSGMNVRYYVSGVGNHHEEAVTTAYKQFSFTFIPTATGSLVFYGNAVAGKMYIKDIQIELGTEATPYQPYTKQTLSFTTPNGLPGIPVTDASLANYTDENGQMWCCDERDWDREIYVGNMLDASKIQIGYINSGTGEFVASGGNYCSDYILINGENIIISTKDVINMYGIAMYDSKKQFIKCEKVYNSNNYTVVTNNVMYVRVWFVLSADVFPNCDPMIRPVEIDGIPTSAKYVPYTDGKFVKRLGADVKRIGREVFDGSDDEPWAIGTLAVASRFAIRLSEAMPQSSVLCSQGITSTKDGSACAVASSKNFYIDTDNTVFTSVELWKNHLISKPMIVDYILATPILSHIPEEEIAARRALHTNYPSTTILSNADHEVEYVTDTKTYIDNKFAELAAAYVAGSEV